MLRASLFALSSILTMSAFPQQCLTHELSSRLEGQPGQPFSPFTPKGSSATMPVVVHVVWNTPSENMPNATIMTMLDQLQLDFSKQNPDTSNVRPVFSQLIANAAIDFCLATIDPAGNTTTGITRTFTSDNWFDPMSEADNMKSAPDGIAPWDPASYLNIWICDISSGAGANITNGYTYLPQTGVHGTPIDGIVLDYDNGLGPTFRTLTHEVGHYFGLQHTWGNGGCADDDDVNDTPNTNGPTTSCANDSLIRCNELTQYENFMEYSPCRAMFTTGQTMLMDSMLTHIRGSLLTSPGCDVIMGSRPLAQSEILIFPIEGSLLVSGLPFNSSFEVRDITGRLLMRKRISSNTSRITTAHISLGLHLLSVHSESGEMLHSGLIFIR